MLGLFYPYGIVLQAIAILHFVRRRPGDLLALDHPDVWRRRRAALHCHRGCSRRRVAARRCSGLSTPQTHQGIGGAHLRQPVDRQLRRARRSVSRRPEVRARARMLRPGARENGVGRSLLSPGAVRARLERLCRRRRRSRAGDRARPKYDYLRAAGLRAHALTKIGQGEKAHALFAETLQTSTLSETQYNYACFLAAEGRDAEARQWAEAILRKKATMPDYIRRRERPWFRKARALLKTAAAPAPGTSMSRRFKYLETKAVHAGHPVPRIAGAVAMPIFQSAMFEYAGETSYHDLKYIRLNNTPSHVALHGKLAALEGGEAALVAASGMAAISTTLLTVLSPGDRAARPELPVRRHARLSDDGMREARHRDRLHRRRRSGVVAAALTAHDARDLRREHHQPAAPGRRSRGRRPVRQGARSRFDDRQHVRHAGELPPARARLRPRRCTAAPSTSTAIPTSSPAR